MKNPMRRTDGFCKNPRCNEIGPLRCGLCLSCRWVGVRAFAVGTGIGGFVYAIIKLLAGIL